MGTEMDFRKALALERISDIDWALAAVKAGMEREGLTLLGLPVLVSQYVDPESVHFVHGTYVCGPAAYARLVTDIPKLETLTSDAAWPVTSVPLTQPGPESPGVRSRRAISLTGDL